MDEREVDEGREEDGVGQADEENQIEQVASTGERAVSLRACTAHAAAQIELRMCLFLLLGC
jgi:hypothetical protein